MSSETIRFSVVAVVCASGLFNALGCDAGWSGGDTSWILLDKGSGKELSGPACVVFCYEKCKSSSWPDIVIDGTPVKQDAQITCGPLPLGMRVPVRLSTRPFGVSPVILWCERWLFAVPGYKIGGKNYGCDRSSVFPPPHLKLSSELARLTLDTVEISDDISFFSDWYDLIENSSKISADMKKGLYETVLAQHKMWEQRWGSREARDKLYDSWRSAARDKTDMEWVDLEVKEAESNVAVAQKLAERIRKS